MFFDEHYLLPLYDVILVPAVCFSWNELDKCLCLFVDYACIRSQHSSRIFFD